MFSWDNSRIMMTRQQRWFFWHIWWYDDVFTGFYLLLYLSFSRNKFSIFWASAVLRSFNPKRFQLALCSWYSCGI